MKNAYVKYQDDWVAIRNKNPEECEYCGVIQCRNGKKYKIPTFLFFSEKPISEMDEIDFENVYEACKKRFPQFEDVLNCQVNPKYDNQNILENYQEWEEAPTVGCFKIPDEGELIMDLGASIYREKYES